jgi:hypothetical protein
MPKINELPSGSIAESTTPYISATSKKLHHAANRALDHYLKPNPLVMSGVHTPNTIFVVAPDIDNETLLAHACESLASANVMASEIAAMLEGAHRSTMLALQQVIMLGELAVNRVLDNVAPSHPA